jgi:hypothetical protein
MEIAIGGEALGDEFGADDLAIAQNQASSGLVRKDDVGNPCYQQRISNAKQHCGNQGE